MPPQGAFNVEPTSQAIRSDSAVSTEEIHPKCKVYRTTHVSTHVSGLYIAMIGDKPPLQLCQPAIEAGTRHGVVFTDMCLQHVN